MNTITYRTAETSDYPAIHALLMEFATYIISPDYVSNTPEQMLSDQEYFRCMIALDGETIVGFATYFIAYYSWSGKAMYLDDLYVRADYRGNGIGRTLFEHIIQTAQQEKCKKLRWQVSNWNTKAIEFYTKMGAAIDPVEINCTLMIGKVGAE